ncbi:MAG: hypothetical protein ACE5G2_02890 [Candidatus Krumholzibacteriia bacterium]
MFAAASLAVAATVPAVASSLHAAKPTHEHGAHSRATADPPQAPSLSVFHISAEPPAEVSQHVLRRLQESCIERLPELIALLDDSPAHAGPYEAHLHVVSVEQVVEHLEPDAAVDASIRRAFHTIQHGLRFWAHSSLQPPPRPQFLAIPSPLVPETQLGPYPEDPRAPIEVFRRRGERYVCRVEILFENHEPHPFDFEFDEVPTASFHRTAQWGSYPDGRSATRLLRWPIRWSLAKAPPDPVLNGVSPALELLRLQLSTYTDGQKRRLFERHGKRFGHRDTQRLERPLFLLDNAENAVVITVGWIWLSALAGDLHFDLSRPDVRAVMDLDAPGVAELLEAYPHTREGAAALIGTYTADPMAVIAKLGPVLDR